MSGIRILGKKDLEKLDVVILWKGNSGRVSIHGECPNCGAELHLDTFVGKEPGFFSDTAVFYCKSCGYVITKVRDDLTIAQESNTVGVRWD